MEGKFQYIDIGTHVRYIHEFMDLRDNRKEFDHGKEIGDVGIPAFVCENGTITLDPTEVGLVEYGTEIPSCSIEDHKWNIVGIINAEKSSDVEALKKTDFPRHAYELGRSL